MPWIKSNEVPEPENFISKESYDSRKKNGISLHFLAIRGTKYVIVAHDASSGGGGGTSRRSVDPDSRVSQADFCCVSCGHSENADTNAAKVLLQRFHARANRSCQLGEASSQDSQRPKKRLRVVRRRVESFST